MEKNKLTEKDFEGIIYDTKGRLIVKTGENVIKEFKFKLLQNYGRFYITNQRVVWIAKTPTGIFGQKGRAFVQLIGENIISVEQNKYALVHLISIHFKYDHINDEALFLYKKPMTMPVGYDPFKVVGDNEIIYQFAENKSKIEEAVEIVNKLINNKFEQSVVEDIKKVIEHNELTNQSVSSAWYLVPIIFGIIGGAIGYLIFKNKNKSTANNLLNVGIVVQILFFILTVL